MMVFSVFVSYAGSFQAALVAKRRILFERQVNKNPSIHPSRDHWRHGFQRRRERNPHALLSFVAVVPRHHPEPLTQRSDPSRRPSVIHLSCDLDGYQKDSDAPGLGRTFGEIFYVNYAFTKSLHSQRYGPLSSSVWVVVVQILCAPVGGRKLTESFPTHDPFQESNDVARHEEAAGMKLKGPLHAAPANGRTPLRPIPPLLLFPSFPFLSVALGALPALD